MKFQTNDTIEVPESTGGSRFRTLKPGKYTAIVNKMESDGYKGRVYDRGTKDYVQDKNGKARKFQYATVKPELVILTEDSPVEISRESYVVGVMENDVLINPAEKYGSGSEGGDTIWFDSGGAGYLLSAVGIIRDGGFADIEVEDIRDVVISVRTDVAGFIPKPVSRSFRPDQLTEELQKVNDGQEFAFEDLEHLVLRFNVTNGYTVVADSDGEPVYTPDNVDEITRESYAEIMNRYRDGELEFVDTYASDDEDDELSGVRLKTKTVVRNFFALSAREASAGGYYHDEDTGVTYVTKASADQVENAELSGW